MKPASTNKKLLNISPEMELHTIRKNSTITLTCCSQNQCLLKRFNFESPDIIQFISKSNYKMEDFLLKTPEIIASEAKDKNCNLDKEQLKSLEKEHRLKLCNAYQELFNNIEEDKIQKFTNENENLNNNNNNISEKEIKKTSIPISENMNSLKVNSDKLIKQNQITKLDNNIERKRSQDIRSNTLSDNKKFGRKGNEDTKKNSKFKYTLNNLKIPMKSIRKQIELQIPLITFQLVPLTNYYKQFFENKIERIHNVIKQNKIISENCNFPLPKKKLYFDTICKQNNRYLKCKHKRVLSKEKSQMNENLLFIFSKNMSNSLPQIKYKKHPEITSNKKYQPDFKIYRTQESQLLSIKKNHDEKTQDINLYLISKN